MKKEQQSVKVKLTEGNPEPVEIMAQDIRMITRKELIDKMTRYCKRDVIILGDHPHSGEMGTTVSVDFLMNKPAILVNLENGESCYVFSAKELHFIPNP